MKLFTSLLKNIELASRWIPYELTYLNQKDRVEACQGNLAFFIDGPSRLCDIISGDESWFYLRYIGYTLS